MITLGELQTNLTVCVSVCVCEREREGRERVRVDRVLERDGGEHRKVDPCDVFLSNNE